MELRAVHVASGRIQKLGTVHVIHIVWSVSLLIVLILCDT